MQRGQWHSQGSAAAVAALITSFVAVAAADALGESFERVYSPVSCLACIVQTHRNAAVPKWQTSDGDKRSDRPFCTEFCYTVSLVWELACIVHCDRQDSLESSGRAGC